VRRALVVCQVAVAVVLLVGAGLLLKSFARLLSVPSGIDASNVLTARVSVPSARYPGLPEVSGFFSRVLDRTRALPGVETAGASTGLPLAFVSGDWGFDIEGRPRVNGRRPGRADWYVVTPGYFEALRIRVVSGRAPTESDTEGAPAVIFLNESAARTLFPQGDAVGKRVRLSNTTGAEQPWRTVAGIVGDVRARGLDQQMRTEMFIPYRQFQHYMAGTQARAMTLVVRTSGNPEQLISALRGELRTIDPLIPLSDPRSMDTVLTASVADRRLSLSLVGAFALLSIVLATVGVYGVVSYDALQRTREIGIRMALGASRQSVVRMMFGRGVRLVAVGAVIGLVAAGLLTRGLSQLLFQVSPLDVSVFAGVAALLVTVGALATFLPARRANRIDPLRALRVD
jgi:predicted permease